MPDYKRTLTIDPGITATGYAFFPHLAQTKELSPYAPTAWGTILGSKCAQNNWQAKARYVAWQIRQLIRLHQVEAVIIEMPGLWVNATSFASAQSGDLFKLAALVGMIDYASSAEHGILYPEHISPQKWKGQLPKKVVEARVRKRWSLPKDISNHAFDAIGIGLALQGGL